VAGRAGWWRRVLPLWGWCLPAGRKYGSGGGVGGDLDENGDWVGDDPCGPSPVGYDKRGERDRTPCLAGQRAAWLTLLVGAGGVGGDTARPEAEHLPAGHEIESAEVSSDGEAGDMVEPPAPSQELAVVQSSAGPSSGLGATDLVWPCPEDSRKVQFILQDEQEDQLWDVLGGRGLAMESDLAQTKARLEEALERVKLIHQAVTIDLPHITEVSFLCF